MTTLKKQKSTGKTTKKKGRVLTVPYEDFLMKELEDVDFSAGYLTACLEEGVDVFLLGVSDVAKSKCGMSALAKASKLNRENLYDMLSEGGNPRLSSLVSILDALGFRMEFQPKEAKRQ